MDKLHEICPKISRIVLYETITDRLKFRKPCVRSVPKMLTDQHKANRVHSASTFLDRYAEEEENRIDSIVTGDET